MSIFETGGIACYKFTGSNNTAGAPQVGLLGQKGDGAPNPLRHVDGGFGIVDGDSGSSNKGYEMTNQTITNKEMVVELKLRADASLPVKRLYSNYVEVAHSPYDFTLRFCDVGPIDNVANLAASGGEHKVPVVAEIAIPFQILPGLIQALQRQVEQHRHASGAAAPPIDRDKIN
ncbi:MAG: DUF3467 domain-containing protein [Pseudomonadota bacterium]